jgi:tRNA 2-thiouridine synthesizing protein B
MTTLHTVNKSPFEKNSLSICLDYAKEGSSILLIEDGVYGAMQGTINSDALKAATANRKVFVLSADLKLRGLSQDKVIEGIEMVDYAGFVELAASNDKVQAWL